ncbi:MAG: hypothetical protein GY757_60850 [bacterium]|nr:hypothetical protein [bacterium]
MKLRAIISLVITLVLILGGMFSDLDQVLGTANLTLTAAKVKKVPTGLDDPLWEKARATRIPLEGKDKFAGNKKTLTAKAIYTYEDIYFLFTWKDATRSVIKKTWKFDGQKWTHLKGDEDRIALLFEITRIKNFASQGCAATCHGPYKAPLFEYKFSTGTAAEKGDLWHWKAARTDPYNHADDGWLTIVDIETGRRYDAGKGGDIKNETVDKSRPIYMQDPTLEPSRPGFLLMNEAVKITDYSAFKTGDTIPFHLPYHLIGSRGDIKTISRHADGSWTLMLYRQLDTDNNDDVMFNPRKKYSFAAAVFDNSGDEDSYDSETTITLRFSR